MPDEVKPRRFRRPGPSKTITMWGRSAENPEAYSALGVPGLIKVGLTARRSSGDGEPQTISLKPDGGALVGGTGVPNGLA